MRRFKRLTVALCVSVLVLALAACGSKKITGTWSAEEDGVTVTYTFNDDGTGSMDIGSGIVLPLTYTTTDDKLKLTYSFLGSETSDEYTYSVKKKQLTLSDGSSSVTLDKR